MVIILSGSPVVDLTILIFRVVKESNELATVSVSETNGQRPEVFVERLVLQLFVSVKEVGVVILARRGVTGDPVKLVLDDLNSSSVNLIVRVLNSGS